MVGFGWSLSQGPPCWSSVFFFFILFFNYLLFLHNFPLLFLLLICFAVFKIIHRFIIFLLFLLIFNDLIFFNTFFFFLSPVIFTFLWHLFHWLRTVRFHPSLWITDTFFTSWFIWDGMGPLWPCNPLLFLTTSTPMLKHNAVLLHTTTTQWSKRTLGTLQELLLLYSLQSPISITACNTPIIITIIPPRLRPLLLLYNFLNPFSIWIIFFQDFNPF